MTISFSFSLSFVNIFMPEYKCMYTSVYPCVMCTAQMDTYQLLESGL